MKQAWVVADVVRPCDGRGALRQREQLLFGTCPCSWVVVWFFFDDYFENVDWMTGWLQEMVMVSEVVESVGWYKG